MSDIVDTAALRELQKAAVSKFPHITIATYYEPELSRYIQAALAALPALLDEVERRRAADALVDELVGALEWATKQIGILSEYIETPEALARFDHCRALLAKVKG